MAVIAAESNAAAHGVRRWRAVACTGPAVRVDPANARDAGVAARGEFAAVTRAQLAGAAALVVGAGVVGAAAHPDAAAAHAAAAVDPCGAVVVGPARASRAADRAVAGRRYALTLRVVDAMVERRARREVGYGAIAAVDDREITPNAAVVWRNARAAARKCSADEDPRGQSAQAADGKLHRASLRNPHESASDAGNVTVLLCAARTSITELARNRRWPCGASWRAPAGRLSPKCGPCEARRTESLGREGVTESLGHDTAARHGCELLGDVV